MMSKQSPSTQPAKKPVMPKKTYSREFKLETLRLVKSSGKTKADLERELGLYPGQIHLWERAFNKEEGNVEQAFPGIGRQNDAEAELSRLRRELDIVRQERDILKKAIAYGHSPSSPRRKTETEVRLHPQAPHRVRNRHHVQGAECIKRRILHMGQASR